MEKDESDSFLPSLSREQKMLTETTTTVGRKMKEERKE